MTAFWTEEDEERLLAVRKEYEELLSRRARQGAFGVSPFRASVSALALYQARRLRDRSFPELEGLLGEPAWDLLLDLHTARERHRAVSVSSACHSAAAPTTTALRFVRLLENRGLLQRSDHPTDRRTRTVTLTKCASDRMRVYLDLLGG